MLMSTTGLGVSELYTANYFLAGLLLFFTAVIFLLMSRLGCHESRCGCCLSRR